MIHSKTLLLILGAVLCVEAAVWIFQAETAYAPLLILGTARVVETLVLFLIVSTQGKGLSPVGLDQNCVVAGLKKGLIWSAVFAVCALLGFVILHAAHMNPLRIIKTRLPQSAGEIALFFIVGGLVAPVAEEVFFRGVVYGFLRRWGVLVAVVGSTVLFVAPHWRGAGIPMTQIVGGIVFAAAYEVEGSLMVPIAIHVLGNTAIFALSLAAL